MLKKRNPPKEKNKSLIPHGLYCYEWINGTRVPCPYWDHDEEKHCQEWGYCHFMEIGDWQINEESDAVCSYSKDHPEWVGKKVKDIKELPWIPTGLLWDMCKECEENREEKITNEQLVLVANKGEKLIMAFSAEQLRNELIEEVGGFIEDVSSIEERLIYLSKTPAIIALEDHKFAITGRDIYGNDLSKKEENR